MAGVMPRLRIRAQPKTSYRPRYMCEGRPCRNRAQRFVRADDNPDKYDYPTIEVTFFEIIFIDIIFFSQLDSNRMDSRTETTNIHSFDSCYCSKRSN